MQCMYNTAFYMYKKPLHSLFSWSGYKPDCQMIEVARLLFTIRNYTLKYLSKYGFHR